MATAVERQTLILAANRALWGEVSASVRAVYASITNDIISINFFFDGNISHKDYESVSRVGSELAADFPEYRIQERSLRLDAPNPIPPLEGWDLVFLRREGRGCIGRISKAKST